MHGEQWDFQNNKKTMEYGEQLDFQNDEWTMVHSDHWIVTGWQYCLCVYRSTKVLLGSPSSWFYLVLHSPISHPSHNHTVKLIPFVTSLISLTLISLRLWSFTQNNCDFVYFL
jgi:hypothetical protein